MYGLGQLIVGAGGGAMAVRKVVQGDQVPFHSCALPAWIHEYNDHRPHTACGNKPQITRMTNLSGQYT
jgi:hypothetical protein